MATIRRYRAKHGVDAAPQGPGITIWASSMRAAMGQAVDIHTTEALRLGTQAGYWHRWVVRECFGKRRRRVLRLPNGERWRR